MCVCVTAPKLHLHVACVREVKTECKFAHVQGRKVSECTCAFCMNVPAQCLYVFVCRESGLPLIRRKVSDPMLITSQIFKENVHKIKAT